MLLLIQDIAGWIVAHWRLVAIVAAGLALIVAVVIGIKSCGSKPKLDQQEIHKAQQAIRTEDRKEMVEILAASDVREQGIDNSIKAAEEATEKAKRDYSKLSNQELADELEKRLHE